NHSGVANDAATAGERGDPAALQHSQLLTLWSTASDKVYQQEKTFRSYPIYADASAAATAGERGDSAALQHSQLLTLWSTASDKVYQQAFKSYPLYAAAAAATAGERGDPAALQHSQLLTLWSTASDKVYQQELYSNAVAKAAAGERGDPAALQHSQLLTLWSTASDKVYQQKPSITSLNRLLYAAAAAPAGERGDPAALQHSQLLTLWSTASDKVYQQAFRSYPLYAAAAAATAGERGDPAALQHSQLLTLWSTASDKVYQQDDHGPVRTVKHALSQVATEVTKLATFAQEREYDMMSLANVVEEKPTPPVVLRAQMVKKQLEETKTLTIKLESREADIKELRKAFKATKEELSEMQIRRDLGERKLAATARDAELRAEQLQRKLEDATNQLKRKEKEFEETMDHLQQDIDSLESERGALRDKLKLYAKRGAGGHHAVPAAVIGRELTHETPVKVAPGVAAGEVNEALQHQIKILSWTVDRERAARVAATRRSERCALRSLRPLSHSSAPSQLARRAAAAELQRDLDKLHTEWTLFVARSGLVQFPDDPAKYGSALRRHKEKQREIRRQLEERLAALQEAVKAQLLLQRPWRAVDAALAQFPQPDLTKALSSKALDVGTIQYPADAATDETVYVTPAQLIKLKELVAELQSDDVKLDLIPLDNEVCAA
ncbi:hypothetical protein JYU34_018223, partial [Plutella xylostella]